MGISRITLKFQVICWDIYYFSEGYDTGYRINTKLSMNYSFGKKSCAELVNTRGVAGE